MIEFSLIEKFYNVKKLYKLEKKIITTQYILIII